MHGLQKFAFLRSSVHDYFELKRRLSGRSIYRQTRAAALAEWRQLCAT